MKNLRSLLQNKQEQILGFPTLTLLVLLALLPLGFWVRYQIFLINGGLAESYIDWALVHYFGGLTPTYVRGADDIVHLRPWSIISYPPGYSLFIAIWKFFGINNLQKIRLAQASVDCLTVFPIFYVLSRLGVRQTFALGAAGVYAVAPLWAFGSVMLLAEAFSPPLMAWLLALMLFVSRRRQMLLWLATGVLVALSALIRPDLVLFIAPLLLWTIFTAPADRRIHAVMMTIVGFCTLMFFWGAYHKINNGHWIFTSNAGNYALWCGLGQLPNDYGYFVSDAKAIELLMQQGIDWHSAASESYWRAAYQTAWREHPDYVLKTIIWRFSKIPFDHQSYLDLSGYFSAINTYLTNYGFFVLCLSLVALVIQKKFSAAYIISLPLIYALGSLGLVYYESRYIRYVPLSYIFASAILINLLYSGFVSLSPILRKRVVTLGLAAFALIIIGNYVSRNMLVLNEETTKVIQVNDIRLAVAQGRTKPIATLKDLKWTKALPEVSFKAESDSLLSVNTSQGRIHYQLMAPLQVSNFSVMHVEYDVRVDDGGMALGLLLPDGSRFIDFKTLSKPGDYIDSWDVPLKNLQSVTLVLLNSRSEDGQSRFVVRKLNLYAR
jgi:hypothetical protein